MSRQAVKPQRTSEERQAAAREIATDLMAVPGMADGTAAYETYREAMALANRRLARLGLKGGDLRLALGALRAERDAGVAS